LVLVTIHVEVLPALSIDTTRDIPPVCIKDVVDFDNLSRSPVETV
jgi:hypothetical protein